MNNIWKASDEPTLKSPPIGAALENLLDLQLLVDQDWRVVATGRPKAIEQVIQSKNLLRAGWAQYLDSTPTQIVNRGTGAILPSRYRVVVSGTCHFPNFPFEIDVVSTTKGRWKVTFPNIYTYGWFKGNCQEFLENPLPNYKGRGMSIQLVGKSLVRSVLEAFEARRHQLLS